MALPAPGNDRQLAEQVARLQARPLDRGRPLWEMDLIQGLPGGRLAVLTKVHHAAVDGVSGGELLSVLLDPDPTGGTVDPAAETRHGEAVPGQAGMLLRGLFGVARQPMRALAAAPRALPHLDQVPTLRMVPGIGQLAAASARVSRARGSDGGVLERTMLRAPRTHFNRRIGPHRRFAFASLPLADVKAIKNALGVTVNDVIMALTAGARRWWLAERDDLPAQPLLAMIPVSVRTPEQAGTFGNRVSQMIVPLPTDEPHARQRVARINDVVRSAKDRHHATPATLMQDANHFIPPAPMYLAGAQLQAQYPVSMIMDGVGLNLTVLSYRDKLDFGVVADRDLVPDVWVLIEHTKAELAELRNLVGPKARRRTRTPNPATKEAPQ